MNAILEVQNLAKVYRETAQLRHHNLREDVGFWLKRVFDRNATVRPSTITALKDVSFELAPGDILGVVGRNGAGKSTLLKILAGIVKPTDGEVTYRGKLVSILELGAGFHPDLTGRENVFLNGELLGLSKHDIRARFDDILEFCGLAEFIDEPVKHYSNGMYLRLAFSVFAHLETNILLLDEIISVGDIAFRQKSYSKLIDVANRGTTIIIVSHDPDQVKDICNKCLFLDKGRMISFGATAEVLNDYLEGYLIAETVALKDAVVSNNDILWPSGLNIRDELSIKTYSLRARNKSATDPKTTTDDLEVTIEFEKLNDRENIEITVTILSLYGTWIVADSYGLYEEFDNSVKDKGHYRCICRIPAGIINFGIYQLGFLVSKSEVPIYQNPCLINFKIDFCEEDGKKTHLARKAASLIKPAGKWEVHRS
jgi:lipopolysaccharide transport system ATP-binding protein